MDKKKRKSCAKRRSARDKLPENFDAIETFWEFWDTHSSADYKDEYERFFA
jgi:hypothetical protein